MPFDRMAIDGLKPFDGMAVGGITVDKFNAH